MNTKFHEPGEKPIRGEDGKQTPFTIDARAWAKDWLQTIKEHPGVPLDEGTMITWFSNSIMAGYDEATRRAKVELSAPMGKPDKFSNEEPNP